MIAALKDKKTTTTIWRKICISNSATELNKKPPKTKKKGHIYLEIVSIGLDAVVKIDDKVYVFDIIKILCLWYYQNCYFSFVFCCAKEGRVVENNKSDVATLKILKMLFLSGYLKSLCHFPIAIAWSVELWSCEDIDLEILLILQWIFSCLSKTRIKKIEQNVNCKFFYQPFGCTKANIWLH